MLTPHTKKPSTPLITIFVLTIFLSSTLVHAECEGDDCEVSPATAESTSQEDGVKKERIKPLWVAGLITFSTVYVSTIIASTALSDPEIRGKAAGISAIPMVGPFIFAGYDDGEYAIDSAFAAPLVISGVLQILGVSAFVAGMAIKRDVKTESARLHILPGIQARKSMGISTILTF